MRIGSRTGIPHLQSAIEVTNQQARAVGRVINLQPDKYRERRGESHADQRRRLDPAREPGRLRILFQNDQHQHRARDHAQRQFVKRVQHMRRDQAHQQSAQRAAGRNHQVEMSQVLRMRLHARQLAMAHHAADKQAHGEQRHQHIRSGYCRSYPRQCCRPCRPTPPPAVAGRDCANTSRHRNTG